MRGTDAVRATQRILAFQQHAAKCTRTFAAQEIAGSGVGHCEIRVEPADEAVGNLDGVLLPELRQRIEVLLSKSLGEVSRARCVEGGEQGIYLGVGVLTRRAHEVEDFALDLGRWEGVGHTQVGRGASQGVIAFLFGLQLFGADGIAGGQCAEDGPADVRVEGCLLYTSPSPRD